MLLRIRHSSEQNFWCGAFGTKLSPHCAQVLDFSIPGGSLSHRVGLKHWYCVPQGRCMAFNRKRWHSSIGGSSISFASLVFSSTASNASRSFLAASNSERRACNSSFSLSASASSSSRSSTCFFFFFYSSFFLARWFLEFWISLFLFLSSLHLSEHAIWEG